MDNGFCRDVWLARNNVLISFDFYSYLGNASRLSQLMQDELVPPREVAAYWVEHILKHGNKHLQSNAKDMPFYQLYLLDVWLLVMAILIFVAFIIYKIIVSIFGIFRSTKIKSQ